MPIVMAQPASLTRQSGQELVECVVIHRLDEMPVKDGRNLVRVEARNRDEGRRLNLLLSLEAPG